MAATIWVVRAGQNSMFIQEFLERHMVAIGWSSIGDLKNVHGREAIAELVRANFPEYTKIQVGVNSGQIYRFRDELTPESVVVTYDSGPRVYHVGKITGEYSFHPDFNDELRHVRPVAWFGSISRDVLSADTKNSLGSIATIFRISESATAEIEAKLAGAISLISEAKPNEVDEPKDELEVRKDTEQRALEFLQDRLAKLDWDQMQDLVAGLIRAMGYKTRVSPPGPDRGRDITASPDGFGFQAPRIVIEVKHRKGAMGAPEIRAFAGGLRHDNSGLYVSTGGFSKEARYEADRANHHVALMDAADLGKAIIEHYDRMDTETRTLLPLKKIYWPA